MVQMNLQGYHSGVSPQFIVSEGQAEVNTAVKDLFIASLSLTEPMLRLVTDRVHGAPQNSCLRLRIVLWETLVRCASRNR